VRGLHLPALLGGARSSSRSCSTSSAAGSSAGSSPTRCEIDLVLDALRMALAQRGPGADLALVHHSDAGSQYTSYDYSQTLDDHGLLASIGTVGDCYDNALAESFVDSFKTELIRDRVWRTRSQLELAIVEYVAWFNNERLHTSLGGVPPAEYETVQARR
jgi:putative transposase